MRSPPASYVTLLGVSGVLLLVVYLLNIPSVEGLNRSRRDAMARSESHGQDINGQSQKRSKRFSSSGQNNVFQQMMNQMVNLSAIIPTIPPLPLTSPTTPPVTTPIPVITPPVPLNMSVVPLDPSSIIMLSSDDLTSPWEISSVPTTNSFVGSESIMFSEGSPESSIIASESSLESSIMASESFMMASESSLENPMIVSESAMGSSMMASDSYIFSSEDYVISPFSTSADTTSNMAFSEGYTSEPESSIIQLESPMVLSDSQYVALTLESSMVASDISVVISDSSNMAYMSSFIALDSTIVSSVIPTFAIVPTGILVFPLESSIVPFNSFVMSQESPMMVSESPMMAPESILMASETSMMASESPMMASETSMMASESPMMASESSMMASESSMMVSESSMMASESSTMASESPMMASESSMMASESPMMVSESSMMASESPTMASQTSMMASESPMMASETSMMASETSMMASESPMMASESSMMASESSMMVSESSMMASESSTMASESPMMASESYILTSEDYNISPSITFAATASSILFSEVYTSEPESSSILPESPMVLSDSQYVALTLESSMVASDISVVISDSSNIASMSSFIASDSTLVSSVIPTFAIVPTGILVFPLESSIVPYASFVIAQESSILTSENSIMASENPIVASESLLMTSESSMVALESLLVASESHMMASEILELTTSMMPTTPTFTTPNSYTTASVIPITTTTPNNTNLTITMPTSTNSTMTPTVCNKTCIRGMLDATTCKCNCTEGYYGDRCGRRCKPCINGTLGADGCSCICDAGWSGVSCDCSRQCENGGSLFHRVCKCKCLNGYRGENCTEPPCNTTMCVNGLQHPGTCQCHCPRGYTGSRCDCSLKCQNGGTLDPETCTCSCIGGYRGGACAIPPCTNSCVNGSPDPLTCLCQCEEGHSGQRCECGKQCENGGILDSIRCKCNCIDEFRGPTCNLPLCDVRCVNGFVDQDCNCKCYGGWYGPSCECDQVCDNGGILNINNITCTCVGGFAGPNCRLCETQCVEPDVLSPKTCLCEAPVVCNKTCESPLKLYKRSCVCTPNWVNCEQFDGQNCRVIVKWGFCSARSNQASCPNGCGMCDSDYTDSVFGTSSVKTLNTRDLRRIRRSLADVRCGALPYIPNTSVFSEGNLYLSVGVYMCTFGFEPIGSPLTLCEDNGRWQPLNFTCVGIQKRSMAGCDDPSSTGLMEIYYTSTRVGATAEYSCTNGYIPLGSGRITCQPNKLWSISSLQCTEPVILSLPIARTTNAITPDVDVIALANRMSLPCAPTVCVQATIGPETTLHFLSNIRKEGDVIAGQSGLRMTKLDLISFDSDPSPEIITFRTRGNATTSVFRHGGVQTKNLFVPILTWWYRVDSCISGSLEINPGGHLQVTGQNSGCTDQCWRFEPDIEQLVEGVTRGHNIAIESEEGQIFADDIYIYQGHLTATLRNDWSEFEHAQMYPRSNWMSVSDNGRMTECRLDSDETTFEIKQSLVNFKLGIRSWNRVLTTSGHGAVLNGSKADLIISLVSGKATRLGIHHTNGLSHFTSVHTVAYNKSGEVVAEISDHPSVYHADDVINLSSACSTWSALVSTHRAPEVFQYGADLKKQRVASDVIKIEWFVY